MATERIELNRDGPGYVLLRDGTPVMWLTTEPPQPTHQDRLRDARLEIAAKNANIAQLTSQVTELERDLELARQEVGRLTADNNRNRAVAEAARAKFDQVRTATASIRAELTAAHQQAAHTRAELDEARSLLRAAREAVTQAEARPAWSAPPEDAGRAEVIRDVAYFLYTNGMTAAGDAVRRQWPQIVQAPDGD